MLGAKIVLKLAKNRKKLNIQLMIVKNLVKCLTTKVCLNHSSKLRYCTSQSIFDVKIQSNTEIGTTA